MSRKLVVIEVVAALGTSGCAWPRATPKGQSQSPERQAPAAATTSRRADRAAEVEWWSDPSLARVGNQADRQQRRRSILLAPVLLAAAAALLIAESYDPTTDPIFAGSSHSAEGHKVRVGGEPEGKPVKAPAKDKDKDDRP